MLENLILKRIEKLESEPIDESLLTVVFTLWGKSITLLATDAEHQKWLIEVNHKSSTPSKLTQEFSQ